MGCLADHSMCVLHAACWINDRPVRAGDLIDRLLLSLRQMPNVLGQDAQVLLLISGHEVPFVVSGERQALALHMGWRVLAPWAPRALARCIAFRASTATAAP